MLHAGIIKSGSSLLNAISCVRGAGAIICSWTMLVCLTCIGACASAPGLERRVMLSSIKAPRLPRRVTPMGAPRQRPGVEEMDAGEPWAAEAKEFLRSRLIGAPALQEGPMCRTSELG